MGQQCHKKNEFNYEFLRTVIVMFTYAENENTAGK